MTKSFEDLQRKRYRPTPGQKESFGQAVYRLIEEKSQADGVLPPYRPIEISRMSGVSTSTLSRVLNDDGEPTKSTVDALAKVLGLGVYEAYLNMHSELVWFWQHQGDPVVDEIRQQAYQAARRQASPNKNESQSAAI